MTFCVCVCVCLCSFTYTHVANFLQFSRESHHMRGLSVLQMCLAMNMYGHLPSEVIQSVFNLKFMDRLDEEIDNCYSKV